MSVLVGSDHPHRIQSVDPEWLQRWGYETADVVGKPIVLLVGEGTCNATAALLWAALKVTVRPRYGAPASLSREISAVISLVRRTANGAPYA